MGGGPYNRLILDLTLSIVITLSRTQQENPTHASGTDSISKATDRLKGKGSVPTGRGHHIVQVMTQWERPQVAVAVRDGVDADCKYETQDQVGEDLLAMELLTSLLNGLLQHVHGHRLGWLHLTVCRTQGERLNGPCSLVNKIVG